MVACCVLRNIAISRNEPIDFDYYPVEDQQGEEVASGASYEVPERNAISFRNDLISRYFKATTSPTETKKFQAYHQLRVYQLYYECFAYCFLWLGQSFSEVLRVVRGVPQGGVLSPVLFNVFTAEPDILRKACVTPKMYAEDIKICKAISVEEEYQVLQRAIDPTVSWSKNWQLPTAPHKTVYMQLRSFTSPTRTYTADVSYSLLYNPSETGFYYNDKLDFTEHIKKRIRVANLRTFKFSKGCL
ncbi:unnamed protein product [Haemonchus placei]|uniref:Reverse transcriptase domain-containing protein n=1 Tax=Haemonchus placei TaxID=6290 RepID=A0A158QMW5_HAEPC|nr:unnamed protein product [Haemonchus placei]